MTVWNPKRIDPETVEFATTRRLGTLLYASRADATTGSYRGHHRMEERIGRAKMLEAAQIAADARI